MSKNHIYHYIVYQSCANGAALRTVREQREQSDRATAFFIIRKPLLAVMHYYWGISYITRGISYITRGISYISRDRGCACATGTSVFFLVRIS